MQSEDEETQQSETGTETAAPVEGQTETAQPQSQPEAPKKSEPQKASDSRDNQKKAGTSQAKQQAPASRQKKPAQHLPKHAANKKGGKPAKARSAMHIKKPGAKPAAASKAAPKKVAPRAKTADGAKKEDGPVVKLPTISTPKAAGLTHNKPLLIGLATIAVIYLVGIVFFWSHYLPFTTINGQGAGFKTPHDLSEIEASRANTFNLAVSGQDINFMVAKDDIDLTFNASLFEDEAANHLARFLWPVMLFVPQSISISNGTIYDDERLEQMVNQNVEFRNTDVTEAVAASLHYDPYSGGYTAVPASEGNQVDGKKVLKDVKDAVAELKGSLELGDDVIVKPAVVETDPRFTEAIGVAEAYPDLTIDLRLSNMVVATATPDMIKSWLTVGEGYEITGNQALVEEWTRGELSEQLDTVGRLRTYVRHDGYSDKEVQVWDGTYGWLIDGTQLAADICKSIHDRSSVPIEIPCTQRAERYNPGGPDWGNRYLDVDITEQYCQMFDEAGYIIWSSECVTGNVENNDGTVLGVYSIQDKKRDETLVGLDNDGDGEPDYENEVDYWMPFYYGYGLHDAIWRDNFDYDTYLTDGSHGCVNLPYYSAASLFDIIEVGDCVVVHE